MPPQNVNPNPQMRQPVDNGPVFPPPKKEEKPQPPPAEKPKSGWKLFS